MEHGHPEQQGLLYRESKVSLLQVAASAGLTVTHCLHLSILMGVSNRLQSIKRGSREKNVGAVGWRETLRHR